MRFIDRAYTGVVLIRLQMIHYGVNESNGIFYTNLFALIDFIEKDWDSLYRN